MTITGSGFSGATAVDFGTAVLGPSQFTVSSDTQITATVPGGSDATGAVDVQVVTPAGKSGANRRVVLCCRSGHHGDRTGGRAAGQRRRAAMRCRAGTGFLCDGGVTSLIFAGKIIHPADSDRDPGDVRHAGGVRGRLHRDRVDGRGEPPR